MGEGGLPEEVAVALIEHKGRYLISQRLAGDSFGGRWEFPGGGLHPGESPAACVVREIQEELGVTITVGQRFLLVEYPSLRLHCFRCRILFGEPRAIECASWRWVAAQHLRGFEFPPASGPIIEALQKQGSGERRST
jgi:mutator protein MutT